MNAQRGLAYIGVLLIVAVVGITAGAAADVWVTTRQRQKEAELLWVGAKFREAILSYHGNTPGDIKTYPQQLEDLLQDKRFPGTRRHLRRIYLDPMTGKADWELLMAPEGGIAGVSSRSTGTPFKQKGFRSRDMIFEGKTSYSEWQFTALPIEPLTPPGSAGPGGQLPGAQPPDPLGRR